MAARTGSRKRPSHQRCTAKTATGRRCKRRRMDGATVCPQHATAANRGGRPPKLTDDVADKVIEILRLGGFMESAAAAVGVHRATLYAWIELGDPEREGARKADEPYRRFRERVEQARAEVEQQAAALVVKAAQEDWRAAAWYLERAAPERWASKTRRSPSLTRDPGSPSTQAPPAAPQLRVVNDQVGPDGSAL